MCGRYYVDDETAREIERVVQAIETKARTGDIFPSERTCMICDSGAGWVLKEGIWGYQMQRDGAGQRLLINARVETASFKHTFADDYRRHRCLIPAAGFYEWNQKKERFRFGAGKKPHYMAALYHPEQEGRRFVILTQEANAFVRPVHNRMPVILSREDAAVWLKEAQEVS